MGCGCDGEGSSFVGGGDDPEQELAAGVVEGCEADLVDDDQVVAAHGFDGFADGVVGDGAVEVLDELDGGEVADLVAGFDGGVSEGDEVVGFAGAGGSDEADVLGSADPFEGDEVVVAGAGIDDSARSNSSRVFTTGNRAMVMRLRVFDLSRDAISSSMSTRRISSGAQRWVFAVARPPGRHGGSWRA